MALIEDLGAELAAAGIKLADPAQLRAGRAKPYLCALIAQGSATSISASREHAIVDILCDPKDGQEDIARYLRAVKAAVQAGSAAWVDPPDQSVDARPVASTRYPRLTGGEYLAMPLRVTAFAKTAA